MFSSRDATGTLLRKPEEDICAACMNNAHILWLDSFKLFSQLGAQPHPDTVLAKRFEQLCDQRRIRPNELATRAGVTPSTYALAHPSACVHMLLAHPALFDELSIATITFLQTLSVMVLLLSRMFFFSMNAEKALTERSARLFLQRDTLLSFLSEF